MTDRSATTRLLVADYREIYYLDSLNVVRSHPSYPTEVAKGSEDNKLTVTPHV